MAMARYGDSGTGSSAGATAVPPSALTLPPGIGNAQQANQASQFMRAQPWYQDFLKSQGQNPNNVHLTKDQAFQLLQLARQKGVGISTKYSLDSSGNIVAEGMPGWEKAAIVAGIVVGGYFLAPAVIAALGGEAAATPIATAAAAGDTAAASTLTAAGATLASTATVPLATGTIAGGTGLAAGAGAAGAVAVPAATAATAATAAAGGTSVTDQILRTAVPTAGSVVSSLIGANASSNASDAQQKYLQEALDYEKSRDAAAIALEGSRYSDYSGNIAPYLATGNSANARMTSLLGLPASPAGTSGPPLSYQPSATSTAAGAKIGAPTAPVTTGAPLPRTGSTTTGRTVTMQAPDGSQKEVDPSLVAHYQQMGATVVGATA